MLSITRQRQSWDIIGMTRWDGSVWQVSPHPTPQQFSIMACRTRGLWDFIPQGAERQNGIDKNEHLRRSRLLSAYASASAVDTHDLRSATTVCLFYSIRSGPLLFDLWGGLANNYLGHDFFFHLFFKVKHRTALARFFPHDFSAVFAMQEFVLEIAQPLLSPPPKNNGPFLTRYKFLDYHLLFVKIN